jgi:hypothetical protein
MAVCVINFDYIFNDLADVVGRHMDLIVAQYDCEEFESMLRTVLTAVVTELELFLLLRDSRLYQSKKAKYQGE